ncbi:MAG: ATP/GTP-binding protein [Candidatus Accumulibacter sp.]|jgi:signal recognition particle receptor subunit beta|nr:ATP/GTP-binding protein [Accumulibacter sp.]
MIEHKILFTGTVGAGKTTAIQAISEIPPVCTDVLSSDPTIGKEKTTVALDYGEISLGKTERLRLYGTPGQQRFAFMWKILAQGALGLVILVDHSRPDPLRDLMIYLDNFKTLIQESACVVVICKMDESHPPLLEDFTQAMKQKQMVYPVIPADVRDKEQVLWILELLLVQMETRQ